MMNAIGSFGIQMSEHRRASTTIKSCTYWYTNHFDQSCEHSLDISPEDFVRWNPSITLDCKNWTEGWSYCLEIRSYANSSLPSFMIGVTQYLSPTRRISAASDKPTADWPPNTLVYCLF